MLGNRLRLTGLNTAYVADATDFDGSTANMSKASDLTGNSDSSQGAFNSWFRIDGGDGTTRDIKRSSANGCNISLNSANKFTFDLFDTTGAKFLQFTSSAIVASSSWVNVQAAWDTNFTNGNRLSHLYIDGVSDITISGEAGNAFNVNYTDTTHGLFHDTATNNRFNGCVSELYINYGTYIDLSVAGNRALFRRSSGKPANLGLTGAAPTGTSPIMYFRDPASTFGVNSGTGGDFTVTGVLTTASTSPSD